MLFYHFSGKAVRGQTMALSYPIIFKNSFCNLTAELQKITQGHRRICIVSDSHVAPLYLDAVQEAVSSCCADPGVFVFEAGEEQKNLNTVQDLYRYLIRSHIQRNDLLLALGGGVTGDLTGFAAATYLRGIDFVQVPTTLLSQVDSSVGGKTGVDFDAYKNMVGAFHQPVLVYMNMSALKTLPDEQYASGMGEVIKTALIRDGALFSWMEEHICYLQERNPEALQHIVRTCCGIKASVVEEDPYDRGIRAILNFGHTIGHAIEKEKNFALLHGHCVALGMVGACRIAVNRGLLSEKDFARIKQMLEAFSLPVRTGNIKADAIVDACLSDKKRENGKLRFILPDGIGNTFIEPVMSKEELRTGIQETLI